jgi:hypothetical protein
MILTPLELACESLLFKASQIRRILAAADVPKLHFGVYDKETLKRLDLKQLQLFLQGSVSPTVSRIYFINQRVINKGNYSN